MSTLTGSDVEILLNLDLQLSDTDKCEHHNHHRRSASHSDDSGAWLVVSYCECHEPHELILCGRYKAWCSSRPDIVLNCTYCGRLTSPDRAYQWVKQL